MATFNSFGKRLSEGLLPTSGWVNIIYLYFRKKIPKKILVKCFWEVKTDTLLSFWGSPENPHLKMFTLESPHIPIINFIPEDG